MRMLINKKGKSLFVPLSSEVTKLSLFLATYHKIQHRTTHLRKQTSNANGELPNVGGNMPLTGPWSHTHGAHRLVKRVDACDIYCNCRTCSMLHDSIQSNFILLIKINSVISSHSIHVQIFKQFKKYTSNYFEKTFLYFDQIYSGFTQC